MFIRKRYLIVGALALCALVAAEVRAVTVPLKTDAPTNTVDLYIDSRQKELMTYDQKTFFSPEEIKTFKDEYTPNYESISKTQSVKDGNHPNKLFYLSKIYDSVNQKIAVQDSILTILRTTEELVLNPKKTEVDLLNQAKIIDSTLKSTNQNIVNFLQDNNNRYKERMQAASIDIKNAIDAIKQQKTTPTTTPTTTTPTTPVVQQPQAPVQPAPTAQIKPTGIVAKFFALFKKTVPNQPPAQAEEWELVEEPAEKGWQLAMKPDFWVTTLPGINNKDVIKLIGIKKTLDATDEVFQKNKAIVLGQATGDANTAQQEILNMKKAFDQTVKEFIATEKNLKTLLMNPKTMSADNIANINTALGHIRNQIRRLNLTIYIVEPPIIVTNTQMEKDIEPLRIIEEKLIIPIPPVDKGNIVDIMNLLDAYEKTLMDFQKKFTTEIIAKYSKPENFNVYDPVIMDISRRIKAALCTIENFKAQVTAPTQLAVFPPLLSNLEHLYNQLVIETNRSEIYKPKTISLDSDLTPVKQSLSNLTDIRSQVASALFTLTLYKNNKLFVKQSTSKVITFKDENGNIMYDYKRDANGNAIDINGKPIVLKAGEPLQENVDIVWLRDNTGKKIPLTKSGPDGKPLMEIVPLDIPQNIVADSAEEVLNKILILEKSFQALLVIVLNKLDTLDKGCRVAYLAALTALDTLKLKYNEIATVVNASSLVTKGGPAVPAEFEKEIPAQRGLLQAEINKLATFNDYDKVKSITATFNLLITNYDKLLQMILNAKKLIKVQVKGPATRAAGKQSAKAAQKSSAGVVAKAKAGGTPTKQKR